MNVRRCSTTRQAVELSVAGGLRVGRGGGSEYTPREPGAYPDPVTIFSILSNFFYFPFHFKMFLPINL